MTLSKTQKIILGVFTFLPFFILPVILFQVFHFVLEMIRQDVEPDTHTILIEILSFVAPFGLMALLTVALLIFYIVHAITNKAMESIEQVMWVLLFFFFGIIAFPIYWFMRIWNTSNNP